MEAFFGGLAAAFVSLFATVWTNKKLRRSNENMVARELEHRTRALLRDTYSKVLTAQRRAREEALRLAKEGGGGASELAGAARTAHDVFIDQYHQLNIDASPEMWLEARALRHVLDDLLESAVAGDYTKCRELSAYARKARQNLERSFRLELNYEQLHERRSLPAKYDKQSKPP